jgi:hypothetical protein
LFLVEHNIPFDVAFGVDDATRTAWCIAFSEMTTGSKFNWHTMRFDEPT